MDANAILNASQQTEETVETKPTNDFDHKFALLAKKERMMREKDQSYSQKDKEWEEKGRKLAEYEDLMKLMDENPIEAIKKRKGWGLQEINEFAVQNSSDEDLDPVAQLTKNFQTQMEALKKSMAEEFEGKIKSKEEEYSKKDYDYQINQFKGSIKTFLAENKEEYEFIGAQGQEGQDLVYDVIYTDVMRRKEKGEEDLTPMDFKTAADKVEGYLDGQVQKFLGLKKVQSKFSSDKVDLDRYAAQLAPKTIDNSFSAQSQSQDQLSAEDRKKRAEDLVKSWLR